MPKIWRPNSRLVRMPKHEPPPRRELSAGSLQPSFSCWRPQSPLQVSRCHGGVPLKRKTSWARW